MNKKCKELSKKNNAREEGIFKENDEIYTDMIVYLRGSGISEYNQELVRADLIELILDGQQRGDDISQVMGSDYKEVCDAIIAEFPAKTIKEKVIDFIEITLSTIIIMTIISIIKQIITVDNGIIINSTFVVTVGDIIVTVVIGIFASVFVMFFCKNAFKKTNNKVLTFLKVWIITAALLSIFVLCMLYATMVVIRVPMIWAVVAVVALIVIKRVISSKA